VGRQGGVGNTASQLIHTLVRRTVDGNTSPQQVKQQVAADLTRYTERYPVPDEPRPRLDRSKAAVAARQAERERQALADEFRGLLYHIWDVYPWTPYDADADADAEEEEAADTPQLHAKAQAMAAALLPQDLWHIDEQLHVARLVVAALDHAWQARRAALEAEGIISYATGVLDVVWQNVPRRA
jgi:hypothetical protein